MNEPLITRVGGEINKHGVYASGLASDFDALEADLKQAHDRIEMQAATFLAMQVTTEAVHRAEAEALEQENERLTKWANDANQASLVYQRQRDTLDQLAERLAAPLDMTLSNVVS